MQPPTVSGKATCKNRTLSVPILPFRAVSVMIMASAYRGLCQRRVVPAKWVAVNMFKDLDAL